MSTHTHHDPETAHEALDEFAHDPDPGYSHGFTDRQYVMVALILAVITAMEVYASYADWLGAAFIPLLLFLMAVKFVSVVLYFMHLKFDSRVFSWLFYSGLFLALGVYIATLLTFKFFNP
jgi:cytochrome c oxidase subunit IV